MDEAALLEHANRSRIRGIDVRDDPVEAEHGEAVAHASGCGLGGVAAAPAVAPEAVCELPLAVLLGEEQRAVSDQRAGRTLPDAPRLLDRLPHLRLAFAAVKIGRAHV